MVVNDNDFGGQILSASWRIVRMTARGVRVTNLETVIPDLIRNRCYYQKTQILTFVRMTVRGSVRMTLTVILNLIQNQF